MEGHLPAAFAGLSGDIPRAISLAHRTLELLAARGASVIVNYVQNAAVAENVVAEIQAAGGKAHAVQADVLDVQQVAHLIAATIERYGRIDILLCGIRIGRNYP